MREQAQGQHDVEGDGPPDQQLRASQHDVECAPRVHWEQSAAVVPEAAVAVVQEAAATRNVGGVEVPPDLPARDRLAAEPAKVLLAAVAGHVVASSALLDGLTALLVGALAKVARDGGLRGELGLTLGTLLARVLRARAPRMRGAVFKAEDSAARRARQRVAARGRRPVCVGRLTRGALSISGVLHCAEAGQLGQELVADANNLAKKGLVDRLRAADGATRLVADGRGVLGDVRAGEVDDGVVDLARAVAKEALAAEVVLARQFNRLRHDPVHKADLAEVRLFCRPHASCHGGDGQSP